jgi:hypothetical protein
MDLEEIKYRYSKNSTDELCNLLPDIVDMGIDELIILKNELKKRGKYEEVESIDAHLKFLIEQGSINNPETIDNPQETNFDSVNSIESIKANLKDKGIDILQYANTEEKKKDSLFKYMTQLKQQGLSDREIDETLKEELKIDNAESKLLISELYRKGVQNVRNGIILSILGFLFGIVLFAIGNKISIGAVGILIAGIWRINTGKKQQQQN